MASGIDGPHFKEMPVEDGRWRCSGGNTREKRQVRAFNLGKEMSLSAGGPLRNSDKWGKGKEEWGGKIGSG